MLTCKTGFCHGYEIIITFFLLRSLKSFFHKARDMVYFKRLIQIPKLPDVREQGVEQIINWHQLHTGEVGQRSGFS